MPNYHFPVIFEKIWRWLWNHQNDTKIEKIEAIETSCYPEEEVSVTVRTSNVDRKLRNNYSLSTKKYFKYSSDKIQERMTLLHVETLIKWAVFDQISTFYALFCGEMSTFPKLQPRGGFGTFFELAILWAYRYLTDISHACYNGFIH